MLALLWLLAVTLRLRPSIQNLAQLVQALPDDILAYIQPEHVAVYVQQHVPRADPLSETIIFFQLDEVLNAPEDLAPRTPSVDCNPHLVSDANVLQLAEVI